MGTCHLQPGGTPVLKNITSVIFEFHMKVTISHFALHIDIKYLTYGYDNEVRYTYTEFCHMNNVFQLVKVWIWVTISEYWTLTCWVRYLMQTLVNANAMNEGIHVFCTYHCQISAHVSVQYQHVGT